jgi:TetR/AcrR family transcriptional repressor of lmrAB and yxaGH operons
MTNRSDARQRAIDTAERLFRAQGYAATGLTQILIESGAPKGSFYFHFPGGKDELAHAALNAYGTRVEQGLMALASRHADDPAGFVLAICRSAAAEMQASGWNNGCLAQNLASELAPSDPAMADAVAAIFRRWTSVIGASLMPNPDSPRADAERRGTALLAALEGARTLARVLRKPTPFDAVADTFGKLVPRDGMVKRARRAP